MYQSYPMLSLLLISITLVPWTTCRKVTQCELATEFKKQLSQEVWEKDLGDWICLAHNLGKMETNFNTSYGNSIAHGIFQITNEWWCEDDKYPDSNGCGLKCSDLLDDDIADDVRCVIQIKNQQGFGAWEVKWGSNCRGKNLDKYVYLENCAVTEPPVPPAVEKVLNEVTFAEGAKGLSLNCKSLQGRPSPDLDWVYDKKEFSDLKSPRNNEQPDTLPLIFPEVHAYYNNTIFTCHARNSFGTDSQAIRLRVAPAPIASDKLSGFPYGLAIGLPVFILILGGLLFLYMFKRLAVRLNGLTKAEIREFLYGLPPENFAAGTCKGNTNVQRQENLYEDPQNAPYDRKYDLVEERLLKSSTKIIGEGQYGFVTKALLDGRPVAVKSVKPNTDKLYIKALLSELKIMIYLGVHPHVVSLVGAVTDKLSRGMLHIVVEFCVLGDLQKYLRNRKASFVSDVSDKGELTNNEYENTISESITTADLIKWCEQIAMGMQHLTAKKVIHGDLAARNVLLDSNLNAKVTDFGLSRRMYDYTNYVKKQQAPLPWRHMSVESLREMSFSTESDVWAYGVTMWEIFSLGDVPYSGRSWSLDFVGELEAGLRLLKPKHAPDFTYSKMTACWNLDRTARPSFLSLTSLCE